MGDPNAVIGREYMFVVEAVSSVTDAKAYMKGKKMAIALLYNEVTADEKDWEDATKQMARFTIFPIQTQFPQEHVMQMTLGEVKKRDNMLEPFHGSLTEESYQLVDYEERQYRQLQEDKAVAAVTMVRNPMKRVVDIKAEVNLLFAFALLGGFALVFYIILDMIVCCCTYTKFENYLASELFTISELVDGENDQGGSSSSMTMKRGHTPSCFHNEILGKEDEILNRSSVGMSYNLCRILTCCCGTKRRIDLAFDKARKLTHQELNITSLIKA